MQKRKEQRKHIVFAAGVSLILTGSVIMSGCSGEKPGAYDESIRKAENVWKVESVRKVENVWNDQTARNDEIAWNEMGE